MNATLAELAQMVDGTLIGDGEKQIRSAEPTHLADENAITFLENLKYVHLLKGSAAGAAIVPEGFTDSDGKPVIQVSNVLTAFDKITSFFRPPRTEMVTGVSPQAFISPTAKIGAGTSIAPGVYIGADVEIGEQCVLYPNVVILDGTVIGDYTTIFPNVTVYENCVVGSHAVIHAGSVIGAYGFGYDSSDGTHRLSAQLGNVVIGDEVDIGACSTIDRGTHGSTRIGLGTKIDNLVMIGHNCSIGKRNLLCAHTGVAGSCVSGDYVVMAGRVGVRDHIKIGSGAVIGAMAGVMLDVPEKARIVGIPATPEKEQMKKQVALAKLPEMRRDFHLLQKETLKISEQIAALQADFNTKLSSQTVEKKRYGLIAGGGNYPLVLARSLKEAGHQVYCLGVIGQADSNALRGICDIYQEMGLGKFGAACSFFRKCRVSEITMAGSVAKGELVRPGVIWRHIPDFYTLCNFFPLFLSRKTDLKNDTLLSAAAEAFEKKGIRLLPGTDLAPNMLFPAGTMTRRQLTESELNDIRQAWPLAQEIGRLDTGQGVAIRNGKILSVEGLDGTGAMLDRAGAVQKGEAFTALKIAKPNQDMRFDVPTVGYGTLDQMAASGCGILVLESGRSICIEPIDQFIAKADSLGIAVAALDSADFISNSAPTQEGGIPSFKPLTTVQPKKNQIKDLITGWPVLKSVSRFGVGGAVTVRERSVVAVESMEESVLATVERTRRAVPDGFAVLIGSFYFPNEEAVTPEMVSAVKKNGASILAVMSGLPFSDRESVIREAEKVNLVVVEIEVGKNLF